MKITNDTTTWQIAELMGPEADELDGRIMMSLISRESIVDTEEVSDDDWQAMMTEACEIRRREYERA